MVMLKDYTRRRKESGAVSLFIVVFAMLLIMVVTLSFLRIMLKDQSQATVNDLSKSALDSAHAGVEDAKRALIYYRTICDADATVCSDAAAAINTNTCNEGLAAVGVNLTNPREVVVQQSQSSNDSQLNQAYTCVKMKLDTDDYLGTLEANTSKVIPLFSTNNYSSILLQWFTTDDFGTSGTSVNLQPTTPVVTDAGTNEFIWPLLAQSSWPQSRPSVMRAQMMQYGTSFNLTDFDTSSAGASNANTLFLYPIGVTGSATPVTQDSWGFADYDIRKVASGTPQGTRCVGRLSGGGYACSVQLNLPQPVGNASGDLTRTAYLRLSALYKSTHFRVSLIGAKFKGVQPSIDSTGRANDQYRRVEERVDLVDTNIALPEAALDVSGNLCKKFIVTDKTNTIPADNQTTCN